MFNPDIACILAILLASKVAFPVLKSQAAIGLPFKTGGICPLHKGAFGGAAGN